MNKIGLVPARFVTLIGHFTLLVMALNFREVSVKGCLSEYYDNSQFDNAQYNLFLGITFALVFAGIEMAGFIFGCTMFCQLICAIYHQRIAITGHSLGCIALSYWLIDTWDCSFFWWTFFFCSFIPGCIEIIVILNILFVKILSYY